LPPLITTVRLLNRKNHELKTTTFTILLLLIACTSYSVEPLTLPSGKTIELESTGKIYIESNHVWFFVLQCTTDIPINEKNEIIQLSSEVFETFGKRLAEEGGYNFAAIKAYNDKLPAAGIATRKSFTTGFEKTTNGWKLLNK